MTAFDIAGGYDPEVDYFQAQRSDNPAMRDSASMWISDSDGRFGLPRFAIEAFAGSWDHRGVEANVAFPNGRVLVGAGGFAPAPATIVDGRAVTLNAGPLTFEVLKPLRQWAMRFDGGCYETTVQAQVAGATSGPLRRVRVAVHAFMATPPWSPGERAPNTSTAAAVGAVGGHRHEQLFRCSGKFQIEGESELAFDGTGLVVRRFGERLLGEFPGHVWMSALFPSGRAFGLLAFPPRLDGAPAYDEAFVFKGERKVYARVTKAPWMTRFEPHGGEVNVVLETEDGEQICLAGLTHDSTFIAEGNSMFGDFTGEPLVPMPFHQGGARFEWDGETTYGMIERSLPSARMTE